MRLTDGEPDFGPWQRLAAAEVLTRLPRRRDRDGPAIIAVDGRSAAGKTTVADRLATAASAAVVVHTDDIAWHHSFFDWAQLLSAAILVPPRQGILPISYRPRAWEERGRKGAIEVPAGTGVLLVEGVGAGRRELAGVLDALVWVQCDADLARARGIARDGGTAEAEGFWNEWDAAENPFLRDDRPWERADVVVNGTPDDAGGDRAALFMSARTRGSRP